MFHPSYHGQSYNVDLLFSAFRMIASVKVFVEGFRTEEDEHQSIGSLIDLTCDQREGERETKVRQGGQRASTPRASYL